MDEALVQHAEHHVDHEHREHDEHEQAGLRRLEHLRGAGERRRDSARQVLRRQPLHLGRGRAERHARGEVERDRHRRHLTGVVDRHRARPSCSSVATALSGTSEPGGAADEQQSERRQVLLILRQQLEITSYSLLGV